MSVTALSKLSPLWPLTMLVLVMALALMPSLEMPLRLESSMVLKDEWWRLVSAHWVHLGWQHSLLNGLGLLLVWYLAPRGKWYYWWSFYIVSALIISTFLLYQGEVRSYVGASGVLHGLLILAAYYSSILSTPRRLLFIGIIIAKLIWEQTPWYSDNGLGNVIGGYVVTQAHLWGGITAGLALCIIELKKHRKL